MSDSSVRPRMQVSQVVGAAALLVVFCVALLGAVSWPLATGLFPRVVSVGGIVISAVLLVTGLLSRRQAAPEPENAAEPVVQAAVVPRPAGKPSDEQDIELPAADDPAAVLSGADRRAWLSALGWVAAFLIGLVVLGLYATILVFTVVYLRVAAKAGWVLSIVYAVVASGVLYVGAGMLLHVPVPEGLLW